MSDRQMNRKPEIISRRDLLGGLTAAVAIAPAFIRNMWAAGDLIVETTAGKVRGTLAKGIYNFTCVPYGASTEGAGRFMPPVPPKSWASVRDVPKQRIIAPQTDPLAKPLPDIPALKGMMSIGSEVGSLESEDCLNVTIYTPGLDSAKRPVMFWCHGGGYAQGSGSAPMYNGAALAKSGNVVVVNVTHRLNVLGYAFLAESGPDFAQSGNVGMLDIALALQWVRNNIARFGGDPKNVFIFGQSGGSSKVATLMSMPSAKGLFHRAAMQSGATRRLKDPEDAARTSAALFTELGLKPNQGRELQKIPLDRLMAAYFALSKKPESIQNYSPVLDGSIVPQDPFYPVANPLNANVPLLIGSVRTEGTAFDLADTAVFKLDEEGLLAKAKSVFSDKTGEAAVKLYRKLMPEASPSDLYFEMSSDRGRRASIQIADLKTAQGVSPAYLYELTWSTPVYDGILRTPHSLDLPMIFNLADDPVWAPYTGGVPQSLVVAKAMSNAWVAFARTGVPGTNSLPWPAYTLEKRQTMVFDEKSTAKNDPFRETRKFWENSAD
jgi:para-nitrobenzyl esterase